VAEPVKVAPKLPQNSAVHKAKLIAETADHPMIQKAAELFGASVTEVKSPLGK
jgi:hypothetical protein